MDYQDCESEEEIFSQEVMETVSQTDHARKGERFLHSKHILELMDNHVSGCNGAQTVPYLLGLSPAPDEEGGDVVQHMCIFCRAPNVTYRKSFL